MMAALLTLFALGIAGLVAMGVVFALLGMALSLTFGLVGFLLFKVGPVLLIGWMVLKLVERRRSSNRISAADQRWLDGE